MQVFARFWKISGLVWSRHGYFGSANGLAKIQPMARPYSPWYFSESSKNLHDYIQISGPVWFSHGLDGYPWRYQAGPDIYPSRAKNCTIKCLSPLTKKCILKQKSLAIDSRDFIMCECTHAPVSRALWTEVLQRISFGGNFALNACGGSFFPRLVWRRYNDFTVMEVLFLQLTFKRETKLSKSPH